MRSISRWVGLIEVGAGQKYKTGGHSDRCIVEVVRDAEKKYTSVGPFE